MNADQLVQHATNALSAPSIEFPAGREPEPHLALLTFDIGRERCALLASDVREVVCAALAARLPKAPPIVEGVLNVRGGGAAIAAGIVEEVLPLEDLPKRICAAVGWTG